MTTNKHISGKKKQRLLHRERTLFVCHMLVSSIWAVSMDFSIMTVLDPFERRFSLTEVSDLIGFSVKFKEGNTQKHTQSVKQNPGQPAADRASCLKKRLKNKGFEQIQREINIANNLQR